eukprot:237541_1
MNQDEQAPFSEPGNNNNNDQNILSLFNNEELDEITENVFHTKKADLDLDIGDINSTLDQVENEYKTPDGPENEYKSQPEKSKIAIECAHLLSSIINEYFLNNTCDQIKNENERSNEINSLILDNIIIVGGA